MKISKDFELKEFQDKGFPLVPTIMEEYLLKMIVKNLQMVRDLYKKPISIRDCYRTKGKFTDQVSRGLHPSMTSDHFWNQDIFISPIDYPLLFTKYNGIYSLSVGALDISGDDNKDLFNVARIVNEELGKGIQGGSHPFGQVIYEETSHSSWVHISNNILNVYASDFVDYLKTKDMGKKVDNMYLCSYDGGENYTKVIGEL